MSKTLNSAGVAMREKILQAAADELQEKLGHLEMQSVANTIGVSPSLISHHFGSRAGLVSAIVNDYYDRFHERVLDRNMLKHGSWLKGERVRLGLVIDFVAHEGLTPVIYGTLAKDAEIAAVESRRIAQVIAVSGRSIAWAQRKSEVPRWVDSQLAGAIIFGAISQAAPLAAERKTPEALEAITEHLWRVSQAALGL